MKKLYSILLTLAMVVAGSSIYVSADSIKSDKKEMRAAWIATVDNVDWPKTKNNPEKQKQEYTNMLDKLKSTGINTVIVQVRPNSDALYKSNINVWSKYLTGTMGKDPGYDPLAFMISETHKRGMDFQAWFNPYRADTTGNLNNLPANHPANQHKDWVVKNGNKYFYDPGLPEVQDYLVDTVMEVVKNYNIDGVHFDDYFYPGKNFNDDSTYKKYGNGMNKDNWRRENVNDLLDKVHRAIKAVKPNVTFGVSPSGIWRNKGSDKNGSDTSGNESYVGAYADTVAWIKKGLVDYIAPQLYWPIGLKAADYSKLVPWWANQVRGTNVDLYIGQGIYKQGQSSYGGQNIAKEIIKQVQLNRKYPDVKGSIYFSANDIENSASLQKDLKSLYQSEPDPFNGQVKDLSGEDRFETAVNVSKEGWKNGADTVVLVNGDSIVDGITSTPLATTYNAPTLLTQSDKIPQSTINELKRLKPKKIFIIGGITAVSPTVQQYINKMDSNINITRAGGLDRYTTSLIVANEIAKKVEIKKAYITSGTGEPDAMSIASKAGQERQPILLSNKYVIGAGALTYLGINNVKDIYFIGGRVALSDNIVKAVSNVVGHDLSANRISGADRCETNAKVLEKFYKQNEYNSVFACSSDRLVDALSSGNLASKSDSPVVLLYTHLNDIQKGVITPKKSSLVCKVGGKTNQTAFNELLSALN